MQVTTRLIKRKQFELNKSGIPVIIKWNGASMIRGHSINSVAHDIMTMSANQDLISINVIGKQSTGKTELCRTLAHLTHEMATLPYNVSFFGKKEILDLEETVKRLTPTNQIIIFDDISFLGSTATKKQIDVIQSVLSYIRHLPGGIDVKIIIFKVIHYTKAIPPFLRQNDMTFFSTVDDSDEKNMVDLVGQKNIYKIRLLKKIQVQVKLGEDMVFPVGKRGSFKYKPKKPFLPFVYTNGVDTRFVMSPLRSWIKPFCQTCAPAKQTAITKENLAKMFEDFSRKFTKGVAKRAIELKLLQMGVNTQPKRVLQAMKYIDEYFLEKEINLEELSLAFGLAENETKLFPNKQPDFKDEIIAVQHESRESVQLERVNDKMDSVGI